MPEHVHLLVTEPDLMMDAPTPVSDKQLKELGIAVVVPKKDS